MKKTIKKKYRKCLRYFLNKKNRQRLENKNFTIISSNCIGGVIYNELGLKFQSPTINIYFKASDFVKFCKNLKYYLSLDLKPIIQDQLSYPVMKLGDITLYCVHYKSFEEVIESWDRRKKRVDFDNIFFIMIERDNCTYEDIVEFDNLPYKNKVIFVHKDMPKISSAYHINGTEVTNDKNHKVKGLMEYEGKFTGKRYIDEFDYVDFFNHNKEQ